MDGLDERDARQAALAKEPSESRRDRWDRVMEWPLTAAALAFLVAYAWPILDPTLPPWVRTTGTAVTTVAWLAFAVDYVVRLWLSADRSRFVRTHVLDLMVVLLPLLRPLRLLRLVTLLSVLDRHVGSTVRGRVAAYVGGASVLVVFVGALATLDAERGAPGTMVHDFGDALWWSVSTVTTVGYGDIAPVTSTGRLVAVVLMLAGIALLGVVTASVASWLVDRVAEDSRDRRAATRRDVDRLREEVADLRRVLEVDRPQSSSPPQVME